MAERIPSKRTLHGYFKFSLKVGSYVNAHQTHRSTIYQLTAYWVNKINVLLVLNRWPDEQVGRYVTIGLTSEWVSGRTAESPSYKLCKVVNTQLRLLDREVNLVTVRWHVVSQTN